MYECVYLKRIMCFVRHVCVFVFLFIFAEVYYVICKVCMWEYVERWIYKMPFLPPHPWSWIWMATTPTTYPNYPNYRMLFLRDPTSHPWSWIWMAPTLTTPTTVCFRETPSPPLKLNLNGNYPDYPNYRLF